MPVERYFFEGNLAPDRSVHLEGAELHHLIHVMRTQAGEKIELINGKGLLAQASVENVSKRDATLLIEEVKSKPKPSKEIILAQAIPRLNRLDFILEKGTELGMSQIWIFPSRYSQKKELSQNQLQRMQTVTIAAMKQCGRLYLPDIVIKPPLHQWTKPEHTAFYGDVEPTAPSFQHVWHENSTGVIFYIGPESGFAQDEMTILQQLGAQGVKLHSNILRTDTAALTALSQISSFLME